MNRVLLIGVDGGTWSIFKPLMEKGVMPFFRQFLQEGVHADLISTPNPLTPPGWTSLYTGRSPEEHGIFDFLRPVPSATNVLFRPYDFRDIQCETIWSMATRQGKRVTSLNFFGMSPPFPVDGYIISGFTTWKHLRRATHPTTLFDIVKQLPELDYKKLGMDIREEKRALWGLQEGKHESWIRMHLERDAAWTEVLCYLMKNDPTDLTAMVFDGPDKLQHLFWRYIEPQLAQKQFDFWSEQIQDLCLSYYRLLDSCLERIIKLAGPETNVLISSDHGFGKTTEVVYLNQWLAEHGYLQWSSNAEVDEVGRIASDTVKDNRILFDWNNTVAYCMTASSNGIFIKRESESGQGVKDEDYLAFCCQLKQQLLDYRHPQDGGQIFVRVHLNEAKLGGKGYLENCPDLTVNLRDGGFVSILKFSKVVVQRKKPEGTHRPNGIFAAWGPDIKSNLQLSPLSILDITPLLLYLLGLPVAKDLEGQVPTEILTRETLKLYPVRHYGATVPPKQETSIENKLSEEVSDAQKEQLIAQLKLLGYMD